MNYLNVGRLPEQNSADEFNADAQLGLQSVRLIIHTDPSLLSYCERNGIRPDINSPSYWQSIATVAEEQFTEQDEETGEVLSIDPMTELMLATPAFAYTAYALRSHSIETPGALRQAFRLVGHYGSLLRQVEQRYDGVHFSDLLTTLKEAVVAGVMDQEVANNADEAIKGKMLSVRTEIGLATLLSANSGIRITWGKEAGNPVGGSFIAHIPRQLPNGSSAYLAIRVSAHSSVDQIYTKDYATMQPINSQQPCQLILRDGEMPAMRMFWMLANSDFADNFVPQPGSINQRAPIAQQHFLHTVGLAKIDYLAE